MSSPVRGTEDILRGLEQIPAKLQVGAIRAGLKAGANIIRDDARLRTPKRTGRMAKAIVSGSPRKNQDNTFSVRVYVDERKPHGFLGYFIEYGVDPHFIAAGGGKSAKQLNDKARKGSLKVGDAHYASVYHPGVAARPFLRPAMDSKVDEVVAAFTTRIRDYIDKNVTAKTGYDPFVDVD